MKTWLKKILHGKWRKRISIQLGLLILASNLLFFCLSFVFLYETLARILQDNYEASCIKRFQQAEYNIESFCDHIEQVVGRVSTSEDMRTHLGREYSSIPDMIPSLKKLMLNFQREMSDFPYIESIGLYGSDKRAFSLIKRGSLSTNYYMKEPDSLPYYNTELYQEMEDQGYRMQWFGGYTINDFWPEDPYAKKEESEEEPKYYITAVRNMWIGGGQIMFCVDMAHFADIFYATNEKSGEEIYVIDEDGCIVASRSYKLIGAQTDFSHAEDLGNGMQSCYIHKEGEDMQVLIWELPSMGWKMVSEIPVKEVIKGTVYLRNVLLTVCLISIVLSVGFAMQWMMKLIKPLEELVQATRKIGEGELGYVLEKVPENEIGVLTNEFNRMSGELEELFARVKEMESNKRLLEMQNLRYQINPHMIYNTLNSIRWMAAINKEKNIEKSIMLLSSFLEPVFKNQNLMCTIREEVDYVQKYVEIMNLRVMKGYVFHVDIPEEYYEHQVIRFLLQPIVENAILHGFEGKGGGEICISMWLEEGTGYIKVKDNGKGLAEDRIQVIEQEKESNKPESKELRVGLANVDKRLKCTYGEEYGLTVASKPGEGTEVVLKIQL